MCHSIERRCRNQFEYLRRQFLQEGEGAFGNIVSESLVSQALIFVGDKGMLVLFFWTTY